MQELYCLHLAGVGFAHLGGAFAGPDPQVCLQKERMETKQVFLQKHALNAVGNLPCLSPTYNFQASIARIAKESYSWCRHNTGRALKQVYSSKLLCLNCAVPGRVIGHDTHKLDGKKHSNLNYNKADSAAPGKLS